MVAIYFHPEAYTTAGPKLMGRNAAGESFLRGFFQYSQGSQFWVQAERVDHIQAFQACAHQFHRHEPVRPVMRERLGALEQAGTLYLPGPGLAEHAWMRTMFKDSAWSLCGVTHTTSSDRAMDAIANLLVAPVQAWDALICTSTAVQRNVQRILHSQYDYLKRRLGASKVTLPLLPVIPLGVHTGDFEYTVSQRQQARARLGAGEHSIVVLYMGRLSFHAKAHPLAMYQALEAAASKLPPEQEVIIVECGWHANQSIAEAYAEASGRVCSRVRVITLDGRTAEARQTAWAGADIFCSLSDNIQETFGITPIEAMAAGLPVVVSDWDGYKDTVRDNIDGFRIPTLMPRAGQGGDLALRHALAIDSYDMYCGHACSLVAVDVQATSLAFEALFASKALRQKMGAAGRERARQYFDWSAIIPRYEALWKQQEEIRLAQELGQSRLQHPWPARLDPFYAFDTYPSVQLGADTQIKLVDINADKAWQRLMQYKELRMVRFANAIVFNDSECRAVLQHLENGPASVQDLLQHVPFQRRRMVSRSLVWLAKLHIVAWQ